MQIPKHIREKACEGLLHFLPKKRLARELGVSEGSIRDWFIYVDNGFFGWVDKPWLNRRTAQLNDAVDYWFEHYPIGCSDVAKSFGVRPATLFNAICRSIAKLPEMHGLTKMECPFSLNGTLLFEYGTIRHPEVLLKRNDHRTKSEHRSLKTERA